MENVKYKEKFSRIDNLIWRVTKQLTKSKKQILEQFDLTSSQFDIMAAIYQSKKEKGQGVIQIDLSTKTQIDPMTTSTILRNLQKRGLIRRERGLVNTRTVEVELTAAGEKLYELAQQKSDKMKEEIYQNLDQQKLASQLVKLSDKLNKLLTV